MPYSPPQHRAAYTPTREQVRKTSTKDYNANRRDKTAQAFYSSKAWKQLRSWYIKRNPLCIECKSKGIAKAVGIVDHIKELSDGGLALCVTNLQSLCVSCHNTKTAQKRRQRATESDRGVGRVKSL